MSKWSDWYNRNKVKQYAKIKARQKRYSKELRSISVELKQRNGCVSCGIKDHRVLDWHHKDKLSKQFEISNIYAKSRLVSKKRLLAEIAKCELLCANCHRIEHYSGA
jgi:hypothetical protein